MAEFVSIPIDLDHDALVDIAIDYMQTAIPGWEPHDGNVEVVALEAFARIAEEVLYAASQMSPAAFKGLGTHVVKLSPLEAREAIVNSTWTLTDDLGHIIRDATYVTIMGRGFQVTGSVEVPAGSTTTAVGGVVLTAVDSGVGSNGLTGNAEPVDAALSWVDSIALVGASAGGAEGETDEEYLERLTEELTTMAPRPITPADYEVFAKRQPLVERALAIDGYDPDLGTRNNERTVAVAVVDANGEPVPDLVKSNLLNELQAHREVNFVTNVIDPTYNIMVVSYEAVAEKGSDPIGVREAINAELTQYLHPRNWGQGGAGGWVNATTLRIYELVALIENMEGVDYVTNVQINNSSTDRVLEGAAPLTRVGQISGTVSPGS